MVTLNRIGFSGLVAGFEINVVGNAVTVRVNGEIVTEQKDSIGKLAAFIGSAKALRLGWARTDDFNIIYIYDKEDDNFGFAVNVEAPDCSEWGYAPF